jgi:hypothetical protein
VKGWEVKPSEKVYWLKVCASVVVAVICVVLQVYIYIDSTLVFAFGALIYFVISDLLATFMKLERGHGFKIGIGAYIFTWLMVWTLLYTVMRTVA